MQRTYSQHQQYKQGSALLVALVITGLLSLITIGISGLIARETRLVTDVIGRESAYFAAEAGLETGLMQLERNTRIAAEQALALQPTKQNQQSTFTLTVQEQVNHIPVLSERARSFYETSGLRTDTEQLFLPLEHNESVTIELDDAIANAGVAIEYYYPLGDQQDSLVSNLRGLDILRFKLFGKRPDGVFESINEFFPIDSPNGNGSGEQTGLSPNAPTPISSSAEGFDFQPWNGGILFVSGTEDLRRCQLAVDGVNECIEPKQTLIHSFLESHTDMTLILTNLIDPDRVNTLAPGIASRLYYRVRTLDSNQNLLFSPQPVISAEGSFGLYTQNLSLRVTPDAFLPIFDFALYRPESEQ